MNTELEPTIADGSKEFSAGETCAGLDHAKGGDMIFVHPGRGWSRTPNFKPEHGGIVFKTADGDELFSMEADGSFKVHGEVVANDRAVFEGFCDWLNQCLRAPIQVPTKVPHLASTAPRGTRVWVVEDDCSVTLTDTRSEPWKLGHGQWVVLLVGRTGGFMIERVFPAP